MPTIRLIAILLLLTFGAAMAAPIPENEVNIKHPFTFSPKSDVPITTPTSNQKLSNEQVITDSTISESEAERELEDLLKDGRIGRLELSWWKKVKHSVEKTLKNLRDKIVDGLAGAIVGGIAG